MNRDERLRAVLDLLAKNGQVEVDDLTASLGVSPATARRDLDTLARQQLLTRTRGGAVGNSVAYDLPIRYRNESNAAAKQLIAQAASALVHRGSVVGLCGGTTATAIATVLSTRSDLSEPSPEPSLTIVTNAVNIAAQLAMRPQFKVVVTGGVVHPRSYELVGPYSDMVLEGVALDLAFIGVNGVVPEHGASVNDESEAHINRLMASRAARAFMVADSSKIGVRSFATVGGAELFGGFITDDKITSDQRSAFAADGIDVIVAS